jgi:hypothetical protein
LLEKLFTYITRVLPLAILKIDHGHSKKLLGARQLKSASGDALTTLLDTMTGKQFVTKLNQAKWTARSKKLSASKGNAGDIVAFFENNRALINRALADLQINRVFVDPSKNSVTVNKSSKGGDVPPPTYPPG